MVKPVRLVTQREREEREQFARAAEVLRELPQHVVSRLPARHRAAISTARKALRRHAHSDESIWPDGGFNMIGRVKAKQVYDRIRQLPPHKRPVQVRDAFMFVLLCVERDAPELPFTRKEIADEIGCAPRHVSSIMGTLQELGVLKRERRPEPGYRGLGRVVYVVDVDVAWNGDLEFRKQLSAQQRAKRPNLKLVQPREAAE